MFRCRKWCATHPEYLAIVSGPGTVQKMSGNAVRLYTEKYAKGIGLNKYAALFKNVLRTAN